jgi:hypothetical protein
MKTLVIFGAVAGSYAGSYLPILWGGDMLSMTSIILGAVGGFFGIWIGYKIAVRMDL